MPYASGLKQLLKAGARYSGADAVFMIRDGLMQRLPSQFSA